MTSPVIEHLDPFEEAIAAICRRNIALDRAVKKALDAAEEREAEEAGWTDWYALRRAKGEA